MLKIRCSQIGDIIADTKAPRTISVGAETVCRKYIAEKHFGRKDLESVSKYTKKGTLQEGQSLELLADYLGLMLAKNETRYENEYLSGLPDIVTKNQVIDIKTAWSCFTFPLLDTAPKSDYWWQLQGYMALTGCKQAMLAHVLTSADPDTVNAEAKKIAWGRGLSEVDEELYKEVERALTYEDLPLSKRIKLFHIEYDPTAVEKIYARVEAMRAWIDQNWQP